MNLEKIPLAERAKLTSQWPVLLVGAQASGKTTAAENLPKEDKKRTILLNMDAKPVENSSDFAAVFTISSSRNILEEQIAKLSPEAKEYKDHYKKILASSYFLDDPESIDRLVGHITKATFSPNIDRVIIDNFKQLDVFCEEWGQLNAPDSRAGWGLYGTSLQKVIQALKECTTCGFKFTYLYGHHSIVAPQAYHNTFKKMPDVKGNIMKGEVESGFNTIIYTYKDHEKDDTYFFESDVNNSMDTSRNKLVGTALKFERHSLDDIEQFLNNKKQIVDFQLVDLPAKETKKK